MELDLRAGSLLEVVPDHHLLLVLGEDEGDVVGFIDHFDEVDGVSLHDSGGEEGEGLLFLKSFLGGVVLDDLVAFLCGDREVLLVHIAADVVHFGA